MVVIAIGGYTEGSVLDSLWFLDQYCWAEAPAENFPGGGQDFFFIRMKNQFSDFYFSSYGYFCTQNIVNFRWIFTHSSKNKNCKKKYFVFHSIQHIPHLSYRSDHFWGGGGLSAYLNLEKANKNKLVIFNLQSSRLIPPSYLARNRIQRQDPIVHQPTFTNYYTNTIVWFAPSICNKQLSDID